MNYEYQNAASIGIIGSSDGPTSVLIADKKRKKSFKFKINKYINQYKRKKAKKKIVACAHTLEQVVAYAVNTYGATEVDKKQDDFPTTSHIYEIRLGNNCLEIEIDYTQPTFGVSFSGQTKAMKQFKKIVKDLYIYYGVSENDINEKTERYLSLLSVLSI